MTENLFTDLLEFQKQNAKLSKTADNPFFKSKYLPLEDILEHYIPKFNEKWILCFHNVVNSEVVTTLLKVATSEKIQSSFPLHNNDPQKQGSEITYGKRYNLWCLLNIQTDEDDDANKASSWWNTKKFYDNKPKETAKPTWEIYVMTAEDVNNWNGKIYWKSVYVKWERKTISDEQIAKLKAHEKYIDN